jgi:predicted phosphodiesterase
MTKILVAGDFHGNTKWAKLVVKEAQRRGCDRIYQVGDFGYWEHVPRGGDFLHDLAVTLDEAKMQLVFVDGNHENHTMLRDLYVNDGMRTPDGFYLLRKGIKYAARGTRWEVDGVRFLALGGAYSVDKEYRTPGHSWWPEETISIAEAEAACEGGEVDVVLSHDSPAGVRNAIGGTTAGNKDLWPESYANRRVLRAVVDEVRPRLLLHGHYHHRNSEVLELDDGWKVNVEGLGRDGMGHKAFVTLETPSLRVTNSPLGPRERAA